MSLRHDDELPPLTPEQQGEAIRLAARLQEEEATRDDFLLAAEEAGIEPRFLREAAHRVAATPFVAPRLSPSLPTLREWAGFALLVFGFVVVSTAYVAHDRQGLGTNLRIGLILATLQCAALAGFWTRRERSVSFILGLQMLAWIVLDIVLSVAFGGPNSLTEFLPVLGIEAAMSLTGIVIAYGVTAALRVREPRIGHNPKV